MAPTSSSRDPYAPRTGCPVCTIVALSRSPPTQVPSVNPDSSSPLLSSPDPSSVAAGPSVPRPVYVTPSGGEVVYVDKDVTVFVEKKDPVSSKGHLIVVFNAHITSLYHLTPTSIPLLQRALNLCPHLLAQHFPPTPQASSPQPSPSPAEQIHIGLISPPCTDSILPGFHLHLHAYIGCADRLPWVSLRTLAFGPLGWYPLEDLIGEIWESTSNNRVKTGYEKARPIAQVPKAGTRVGLPDGRELVDSTSRESKTRSLRVDSGRQD
ncbi:hypothetical protein DACRYDRAFT_22843 [Dacryopinax primogenitus]|uniref:HIT domain-containing protein n=1 Tax=Dacryopinax primogenitus (strain DJM 731) TaxID=1858805 RepID=M5FX67_DACPD|nr:uncharacterized protein DACRYDRAFT_22843 [Dacryopinax primogenitus]EJU01029.1 hypothetical protein DACRYDRAFT_22843 [Dacryopinax primogenitus]